MAVQEDEFACVTAGHQHLVDLTVIDPEVLLGSFRLWMSGTGAPVVPMHVAQLYAIDPGVLMSWAHRTTPFRARTDGLYGRGVHVMLGKVLIVLLCATVQSKSILKWKQAKPK